MVASVGRITAGRGYDYLTNDVATSKHDYYTGAGEAPGHWTGRGSVLLGLSGEIDADDMAALYGRFVAPSTAGGVRLASGRWAPEQVLGRAVSARTRADGSVSEPVAAFDVTFSPSKSVSLLWALTTDSTIRDAVIGAHEVAVSTALEYLDAHAGHTRTGAGGVRRLPGQGFVIAQFRHRTARSTRPGERVGDPQLHSHCAILNRICGADGTWRTLDSNAIDRHAHAAGSVYAATLERTLTEHLGVSWIEPTERTPMREIDGIPAHLRQQFSTRRADVMATYGRLDDEWRKVHGRSPTRDEAARLRDAATPRSRHRKTAGAGDLHQCWLATVASADVEAVTAAAHRASPEDGGRLPDGSAQLAQRVFDSLHEQRSWWTRAHVTVEVGRWIAHPTTDAIELEVERLVERCVPLEADDDAEYANLDEAKYTSPTIERAERRVMGALAEPATFNVEPARESDLGVDQIRAVRTITQSRRRISAVIGPAGAGKTTMLRVVATSCNHAARDVAVLCLSAAAARVVTEQTGLVAHTIASWQLGQVELPRAGMVIVDEASMVPTLVLDQLVTATRNVDSRLALIGDYAQMGAPEAGGLLRDIAATPNACELTAVRRFRHAWEADASILLRRRSIDVVDTYDRHGRISGTLTDRAIADVADAWRADMLAGHHTIVVTDTVQAASEMSAACQQRLIDAGRLADDPIASAADSNQIYVGDLIQTRRNTRQLSTSDGHRVLNRDVWRATGSDRHGNLTATHTSTATTVTITPDYLATDVVLAYATTIAGAQGRTADRSHILVTPTTSAESLYVGMTRGRHRNTAHVICDRHDHDELELGDRTPTQAFTAAMRRDSDGSLSARTIAQRWHDDQPARGAAREADRRLRSAQEWWTNRSRHLPLRLQRALAVRHDDIVRILSRRSNDTERAAAIASALKSAPAHRTDFASRFIDSLNTNGARPTPPGDAHRVGATRGVGRER